MSGHSKWAGIKHKKAIVDAQKGKTFGKLIREVTVAARQGGDPDANPRLRLAMAKARDANMAKDKVEQAIKRGTGEIPGVHYEEIQYEGYGPGGVAILADTLTDNKNRTSSEIRSLFANHGGNMAGAGSVAWLFHKKGFILIKQAGVSEERLIEIALEAGAEDVTSEDDNFAVTTPLQEFDRVKAALTQDRIAWESADLTMIPSTTVKVDGAKAKHVLELVEILEQHDDVQNVHANFDIPDEILSTMT